MKFEIYFGKKKLLFLSHTFPLSFSIYILSLNQKFKMIAKIINTHLSYKLSLYLTNYSHLFCNCTNNKLFVVSYRGKNLKIAFLLSTVKTSNR